MMTSHCCQPSGLHFGARSRQKWRRRLVGNRPTWPPHCRLPRGWPLRARASAAPITRRRPEYRLRILALNQQGHRMAGTGRPHAQFRNVETPAPLTPSTTSPAGVRRQRRAVTSCHDQAPCVCISCCSLGSSARTASRAPRRHHGAVAAVRRRIFQKNGLTVTSVALRSCQKPRCARWPGAIATPRRQIVRVVDVLAVTLVMTSPGFSPGPARRDSAVHRADQSAMRGAPTEGLRELLTDILHRHADPAAVHLTALHQLFL